MVAGVLGRDAVGGVDQAPFEFGDPRVYFPVLSGAPLAKDLAEMAASGVIRAEQAHTESPMFLLGF